MARIPTTTGDWSQYSRWIKCIGRNMRITNPVGAELTAVETFIKTFYNASTGAGSRPWLKELFDAKSVKPAGQNPGNPDIEPTPVDVKLIGVIAADMLITPITDAEKTECDTLIAATNDRYIGVKPYFGGTASRR